MLSYLYLFFIFLTIISGLFVILSDNAVNSVLCLISCFINSAIILIICGFDFFALVFVAIYVSVIAILFLFILIFLNIPYYKSQNWYLKLTKLSLILVIFYIFLDYFIFPEMNVLLYLRPVKYITIINPLNYLNSIDIISTYLYTDYMSYLLLSGIILFFAMLGSIMLLQQYQFSWNILKNRNLKLMDIIDFYKKK